MKKFVQKVNKTRPKRTQGFRKSKLPCNNVGYQNNLFSKTFFLQARLFVC